MAAPPITVLVVDGTSTRASTLRLLTAAGYSTVEAQSGSEALKLLQERLAATGSPGVDTILKNHDPPDSNGVRFLHRLREHPRLRNIPTVVVSNQDSRDAVVKCLSSGAADYWVRPLRPNEVRMLWSIVWRQQTPGQQGAEDDSGSGNSTDAATNILDETEPTSKEGSAPDGSGGVRQGTGGGAGSGSAEEAGMAAGGGNGNGSSRNLGKAGSNTGDGGSGSGGGDNGAGSGGAGGSGNGNGTSATGHFVRDGAEHTLCDASTAAQPGAAMPPLPGAKQPRSAHRHHHHHHSHHPDHRHHSLSATAAEAGSEAPASWQQAALAAGDVAGSSAGAQAAETGLTPALPAPPAALPPLPQPAAAADVFPSPPPRPRLTQEHAVAAAAAAGLPLDASQVSGDGQYIGSNTANGSNGATTNGNGGSGNGNGGVTSKQKGGGASRASPSRPFARGLAGSAATGLPPLPGTVPGGQEVAAASGRAMGRPGAPASGGLPADAARAAQQQQQQRLLQKQKEEEREVERQRGAAEVAEVAEALTSMRDSGSPRNSSGGGGAGSGSGAVTPAGPATQGRVTRATKAAAARAHAATGLLRESAAPAEAGPASKQGQQGQASASVQAQSPARAPASFQLPPLPTAAAPGADGRQQSGRLSPAPSLQQAGQGGADLAGAAVLSQQQQQQQQQAMMQFPTGLMAPFGGLAPFGPPAGMLGFGWSALPPLPSPSAQQQPAQGQAQAAAASPDPSQQLADAAGRMGGEGDCGATAANAAAAEHMQAAAMMEQQRAMLMQQHGQQQAQYAWMLQQYSMAAVAAAATGQPPPPPPPPPPLSGAFGNLMGWPRPPMHWQQQQLPGLGLPGPSLTSPPAFQTTGAASSSMLPPPSGAGAASAPAPALPALPLPPMPLPAEPLSSEQLAKKEARSLAYARYKEKRKSRHFGKKIRYQTRKALAEQRPRVRGQFVRVPKEEAASTGDNKAGGAAAAAAAPSPSRGAQGGKATSAAAAAVAKAAKAAGEAPAGQDGMPAMPTPESPSPASTADGKRPGAADAGQQEEEAEYDRMEEDLGAEEEEGRPPVVLATRLRPRRQYAVLHQDESESVTMSFGGSGHHRQGLVSLHPHRQEQAAAAAAPAPAPAATPAAAAAQPTGASASNPRAGAGEGDAKPGWQQQLQQRLAGHKHRREPAADTSTGGGRNGSDSGSNTPGDQTPAPDSPEGNRGRGDGEGQEPAAKQPRLCRT